MNPHPRSPLFPLGETRITTNALGRVHSAEVCAARRRHAREDWGEISADDKAENEDPRRRPCKLISASSDRKRTRFLIVTQADRSLITVLWPEDE